MIQIISVIDSSFASNIGVKAEIFVYHDQGDKDFGSCCFCFVWATLMPAELQAVISRCEDVQNGDTVSHSGWSYATNIHEVINVQASTANRIALY